MLSILDEFEKSSLSVNKLTTTLEQFKDILGGLMDSLEILSNCTEVYDVVARLGETLRELESSYKNINKDSVRFQDYIEKDFKVVFQLFDLFNLYQKEIKGALGRFPEEIEKIEVIAIQGMLEKLYSELQVIQRDHKETIDRINALEIEIGKVKYVGTKGFTSISRKVDKHYKSLIEENNLLKSMVGEICSKFTHTISTNNKSVYGNINGNISNGGTAVKYKNSIFYKCTSIGTDVCHMNLDNFNEKRLFVSTDVSYMNLFNYVLYYINKSNFRKIQSYDFRSQKTFTIVHEEASSLFMVDCWLYYINKTHGNGIYRVRIDGMEQYILTNDDCKCMNISGDWIYYINASDGDSIYKIDLNSYGKYKITEDRAKQIILRENYIYYINETDYCCIYRIGVDGHDREKVIDSHCRCFNLDGEYIFYGSGTNLFKYKIKEKGLCIIGKNVIVDSINLAPDYVFVEISNKIHRISGDDSLQLWTEQSGSKEVLMQAITDWDILF